MADKPNNPQSKTRLDEEYRKDSPNIYDKENAKKAAVDTELENSERARKARAGDEGYDIDKPQESSKK